jgi:2-keto-4-pentenoate hydratase
MNAKHLFPILGLFFLVSTCKQEPKPELSSEVVAAFLAYQNSNEPFDVAQLYPQLTEAESYQVQKQVFLEKYGMKDLAGYKAALTSAGSQKLLKTDHPAAGYLYKSGWVADGDTILKAAYTLPFIELELGFYTNTVIDQKVPDVASLKTKIASVYPVIEFPDIGFPKIEAVQLHSFIAHNAAAKQFIVGESTLLKAAPDLNALTCKLSMNGALVGTAKGSDAMGDQWEALRFLINQRIEQGMEISPKQVLITGSLGRLFPFETGTYFADFGELGSLNFHIK